jgi:hypothetical protein
MENNVSKDEVSKAFLAMYKSLMKNGDLAFPSKEVIEKWELILDSFIDCSF